MVARRISLIFLLLMLVAVDSQHSAAVVRKYPTRLSQSPAEFFQMSNWNGVYTGVVQQAKFTEEGRYPDCRILYKVLVLEVFAGPEYRKLDLCIGAHLSVKVGQQYLIFVRFSLPFTASLDGIVSGPRFGGYSLPPNVRSLIEDHIQVFPIGPLNSSLGKFYGRSVIRIRARYVDFPEDFYLDKFAMTQSYVVGRSYPDAPPDQIEYLEVNWPHGADIDGDPTPGQIEYVMVDWHKLKEEASKRQQQEPAISSQVHELFPDSRVRALAQAAGKGKRRKLERLAAQGIDVNARGKENKTPLFWALHNNNLKGFKKLLELGADPNVLFRVGSIVHMAAEHENTGFLKAALQHGGDPNLMAEPLSKVPLFETIGLGDEDRKENRQLLLASGADINARIAYDPEKIGPFLGNTPLLLAAELPQYDVVYELLEAGADYKAKDGLGNDLSDLIAKEVGNFIPGSQTEKDLQTVIDWLSHRGVEIPE